MNITVVGAGYVGLTTSACLASLGHSVLCLEKDEHRLASLQRGMMPFHEPRLPELVRDAEQQGRLVFDRVSRDGLSWSTLIIITVGTPGGPDGAPDLSALEEVVADLGQVGQPAQTVVLKSTIPVGTTDRVEQFLAARTGATYAVAYNPEFLREGTAVTDFFHPFRVIIGTRSALAAERLGALYAPLGSSILFTDPATAEMIKYASNAFLATKISFINEMANICERVGVDVTAVASGIGADPRIGPHFLRAGLGFGGSCLPKDIRALAALARRHQVPPSLLDAVLEVNDRQHERFLTRVEDLLNGVAGKRLAVLGLAFKGGTSDVRESPALAIAASLISRGAHVRAFDPAAEQAACAILPSLVCCPDAYEAADGAEAILVLCDWPEFEQLDWMRLRSRVHTPLILDGRGLSVKARAAEAGFAYVGPGGVIAPFHTGPEPRTEAR